MSDQPENPLACEKCGLCRHRTNVVVPTACEPGGLLAIGEAPGEAEDLTARGFVGAAGQRLDDLLRSCGFSRGCQYGVANIVRCRPPGNRKPRRDEIKACIPLLAEALENIRPSVLLLVGNTAADAILGKGTLEPKIEASRVNPRCDFAAAHPAFAQRLRTIDPAFYSAGMLAIPMPHTSGLSWNGRSRKGERWSVVGTQQIRIACALVSGRPVESLADSGTARQGTLDI